MLEPRFSGEDPPQDEVDDGRAVISSDPYFALGLASGWIGLLDTGVRFTHTVFNIAEEAIPCCSARPAASTARFDIPDESGCNGLSIGAPYPVAVQLLGQVMLNWG